MEYGHVIFTVSMYETFFKIDKNMAKTEPKHEIEIHCLAML